MKLKSIAAAALLATTGSAFAVGPGALGTIDDTTVVIGNLVATPFFFDTYTFTITDPGTVFGGAFAVYTTGFTVVLQDATFTSIGTDTSPSDGFSFSGLSAGSYALSFLGFSTAGAGYGGVISTVTAPVPEPETYALMLAGLGMVGFMASRRRNNNG